MTSATPWHTFLAEQGAQIGAGGLELAFNPPVQLARDTVLVPLLHLGMIECSGEDAQAFLHNQLTSNVNQLAADQTQLAGWCTAKGRMQASFLVWRVEGGYWLQLAADLSEASIKRLRMFVLRSKVQLTDRGSELLLLGLAGPQAASALTAAELPVPAEIRQSSAFAQGRVTRLDEQRYVIAVAADAAPALWNRLQAQAVPAGTAAWAWHDVQSGYPLVTAATKEAFVPQMLNFDKLGGVSFNKGCYPGQEIVARTQYLGKVKRHMHRGHAETPVAAGDELFSSAVPDQSCGKIVTAAPALQGGWDLLAVVQEDAFAAPIALRQNDGPTLQIDPQPTLGGPLAG